jgi:hypothetical protein
LKTWRDREATRAQYFKKGTSSPSVDGQDPAGVALTMSKRLIAIFKTKKVLNIEAGFEMMAVGVIICSMVSNFAMYSNDLVLFCCYKNGGRFPEAVGDLKTLLSRFGFQ